jgi:hypothetical protein
MFSQNLKPSQITFYKLTVLASYFIKSCYFESGVLEKPNLETQLEVFQFQKIASQRLFHFIKTWGYFSIAICCPLLERRFTGIFHGGRKFLQFKIHDTFFGLKRNLSSLHWRGTGLEAIRCFEVRRLKTQNGLEIGPSPIQGKLEL